MPRNLAEQFDLLESIPDPFEHNPNVEFTTTQEWASEVHPRQGAGRNLGLGPAESVGRFGNLSAVSGGEEVRFPVQQTLYIPREQGPDSRRSYFTFSALHELKASPPIDPSTGFAPVGPEDRQVPPGISRRGTPSDPHIAKVRVPSLEIDVTHGLENKQADTAPPTGTLWGSRNLHADSGYPPGTDTLSTIFTYPTHEDYPNEPKTGRPPYRMMPPQLGGQPVEELKSWMNWASEVEGQGDIETFPDEIAKHYRYWQEEQDKFRRRVYGESQ